MSTLEIDHIATGYKDVKVVHDISFVVEPGKVTALLGRNGAGKTTTLNVITGMLPLNSGMIRFDGKDISTVRAPKRTGYGISLVQEGKRIFKGLSIDQNLTMGGYSRKYKRSALDAKKEEVYERFPALTKRRSELASGLSGGQQQMLAIGQALMAEPKILLLDEPSAGLAPTITAEIFDIVVQLKNEGIGILLVEQSVDFALRCADRVTVVNLGRDAFEGTPTDPDIRKRIGQVVLGASVS